MTRRMPSTPDQLLSRELTSVSNKEAHHVTVCEHWPTPPIDDPRVCDWCRRNRRRVEARSAAMSLTRLADAAPVGAQLVMPV